MQDNVRNPERGEIKQSVCKHCGFSAEEHPVRHQIDGKYAYCGTFEPVAEPASTGEPRESLSVQKRKHYMKGGHAADFVPAARPSGPSAPQTSAEPLEFDPQCKCAIRNSRVKQGVIGPHHAPSCPQYGGVRPENEPQRMARRIAPQPVSGTDDPEHPIVGPEDGSPCCEHCAKHPGSQWTLKVSQPVSGDALHKCALEKDGCGTEPKSTPNGVAAGFTHGDAPKVEEVTDSLIAFFNSSTIQDADIRNEVAAILRPYFPPVSQTPELEQYKQVLGSEIYDFLKHECIDIFNLLFEQSISPGKAAEAIAERKLGFIPNLPATPASTARTDGPKYKHKANCLWATPLPTGAGFWGCDCGLDKLLLDLEDYEVAAPGAPQAEPTKEEK